MGFEKRISPPVAVSFKEPWQIKRMADAYSISVAHLARDLGLHPQTVREYIKGRREVPRVVWLALQAVDSAYQRNASDE